MRPRLLGTLVLALLLPLTGVAPAAARGPTVYGALKSLQSTAAAGSETAEALSADASTYTAALSAVKRLSGTRRAELASVITNIQQIAAAHGFTPSRLPALFLTLEHNTQRWTSEPLLAADQRVSFPGSHIIWEYYPGQGIEIQWLATFGEANSYYLQGHENTQLSELLNEVIPLATQRAGGIAWEYMFHFDGGVPPWTSGLSQGTALQALARAYSRLKTPAYLTAAQQALKLFQTPPPEGVRVATPAGATYLEYTYAPQEHIINGFIQSLNGLYDYAKLTGDPLGRQLFEAGDAEARVELPHYNTGAWSMYDQHSESNLNYHELLTEFLEDLCKRTDEGPPVPAPTPATASPKAATPTPPGAGEVATTATGGATAQASSASAGTGSATAIPGDSIYCTTAQSFTADLHTPPAISLITTKLPARARGGVQLSLSKIATVSLTVSRGGRVVWTNGALVERGKPRLLWITPAQTGTYGIALRATDLAGNSTSTSGTITVAAPPSARPSPPKAKRGH
ncbi:MAG TPA: D-glucuronyl C5-epimerase family protein [Solirubrobacteraceae bacterium]|nr:D-glucuronyl C5-epimerase family protein [Solirubrobacteraceae bacterium]